MLGAEATLALAGPRLIPVAVGEALTLDLSPLGVERRAAFTVARRGDAVAAFGDGNGAAN